MKKAIGILVLGLLLIGIAKAEAVETLPPYHPEKINFTDKTDKSGKNKLASIKRGIPCSGTDDCWNKRQIYFGYLEKKQQNYYSDMNVLLCPMKNNDFFKIWTFPTRELKPVLNSREHFHYSKLDTKKCKKFTFTSMSCESCKFSIYKALNYGAVVWGRKHIEAVGSGFAIKSDGQTKQTYHKDNIVEKLSTISKKNDLYVALTSGSIKIESQEKKTTVKKKEVTNNEVTTSSNNDVIKDIKKLKKLYDEGVLTKEQFEKAKNKLLN